MSAVGVASPSACSTEYRSTPPSTLGVAWRSAVSHPGGSQLHDCPDWRQSSAVRGPRLSQWEQVFVLPILWPSIFFTLGQGQDRAMPVSSSFAVMDLLAYPSSISNAGVLRGRLAPVYLSRQASSCPEQQRLALLLLFPLPYSSASSACSSVSTFTATGYNTDSLTAQVHDYIASVAEIRDCAPMRSTPKVSGNLQ